MYKARNGGLHESEVKRCGRLLFIRTGYRRVARVLEVTVEPDGRSLALASASLWRA